MLTVIVPTFNRNLDLARCLASIRDNSSECEILVPHPETDRELAEICASFRALEYLDGSRAGGKRVKSLWAVINEGIARASNRYVAWLNDDCVVLPDWDAKALSYFRDDVGLVVLRAKGINQNETYRTIPAAFGIPCANYAILDKDAGVRFDESFSWFYGDADISLQVALSRKLGVVATAEPCVDHLHRKDEARATNETDPRSIQDELRFREKWQTYSKVGRRVINLRNTLIARIARKINRAVGS